MERTASVKKKSAKNKEHNTRLNEKSKHVNNDLSHKNRLYKFDDDFNYENVYNNIPDEAREIFCRDDFDDDRVNELFEEQIELYNSTQKRNDRKIDKDKFFEDCRNDKRGGANDELILQVGSKNDFDGMTESEIQAEQEFRINVLQSVIEKLPSRYPRLKFTQGHLHLDEDGSDKTAKEIAEEPFLNTVCPHAHLNFFGFSELQETKNGKYKKPTVSSYPAIMEMFSDSFDAGDSTVVKRMKAFKAFRNDVAELIHEECLSRDKEHIAKYLDADEKSVSVADYKVKMANKKKSKQLDKRETSLNEHTAFLDKREQDIKVKEVETAEIIKEKLQQANDVLMNSIADIDAKKKEVEDEQEKLDDARREAAQINKDIANKNQELVQINKGVADAKQELAQVNDDLMYANAWVASANKELAEKQAEAEALGIQIDRVKQVKQQEVNNRGKQAQDVLGL